LRSPCRYSAACARRKLLRMVASARGSRQMPVIGNGKLFDLRPVERGYFIGLDTKRDTHHLLTSPIIDRRLLPGLLSLSTLKRALGYEKT
jgi:hypothetical protein